MYLKILKKDLKRKKSMHLILLVFVFLATMFISSSLNNLIVVTSGTEHFFEQAGLGDYLIITMRADYYGDDTNEKNVKKFLISQENVDSYTVDPCMYLATSNVGFEDERKLEASGTMIFSSYDISQQKFFDMENREITGMEDGTIYLPAGFMEKNNVSEEKKQEIAGHINEKVDEIEEYISEIVRASNEDFMEFEVNNQEVYIGNILEIIKEYYQEKMELNQIDFSIGSYSNCLVWADENRLIEVIQNIIENAIKYGDGKKIWLEIKREPEEYQIIVKNTGCTLEEKELPHICDSFFRGSNTGKEMGSGLGLYICRKLIHLMEGEIVPQITSDFHQKIMEVTVIVQTVK